LLDANQVQHYTVYYYPANGRVDFVGGWHLALKSPGKIAGQGTLDDISKPGQVIIGVERASWSLHGQM